MGKNNRKGFSLLEALLAILLIGILFVSVLLIFYQTVDVQLQGEDLATANGLARSAVEEVKSMVWTSIPLDDTGEWYLDPININEPNTYDSDDGGYHIVRTITRPVANMITVTVNVFPIDTSGQAGISETPQVTLATNIYKYGL